MNGMVFPEQTVPKQRAQVFWNVLHAVSDNGFHELLTKIITNESIVKIEAGKTRRGGYYFC
jgi:hypothetical protein